MCTGSTLITLDMLSCRIKAYFFLPAAFFLAAASSISCILAMARPAPLRAPVIKSPALMTMFSTCSTRMSACILLRVPKWCEHKGLNLQNKMAFVITTRQQYWKAKYNKNVQVIKTMGDSTVGHLHAFAALDPISPGERLALGGGRSTTQAHGGNNGCTVHRRSCHKRNYNCLR
jgi:hypothetical protein